MWIGRLLLWREPTGRRWDQYDETGVVEAELFVDVFDFGADLEETGVSSLLGYCRGTYTVGSTSRRSKRKVDRHPRNDSRNRFFHLADRGIAPLLRQNLAAEDGNELHDCSTE